MYRELAPLLIWRMAARTENATREMAMKRYQREDEEEEEEEGKNPIFVPEAPIQKW